MTCVELTNEDAAKMIEKLRSGLPADRFVSRYSTGNERFLNNVRKRHLDSGISTGKIRFVSGSWGAGKSHFLRLMAEQAFDANYLVSNIEVRNEEVPFNRFERVFFGIVRVITSPEMYAAGTKDDITPFAEVLSRALFDRAADPDETITQEEYQQKLDTLMADSGMDIDFRRVVGQYWKTFLQGEDDRSRVYETRSTLIQWFSGEGTIGTYRSNFGILKLVNRENARLMLQSLSRFSRHIGYNGLLILFDESADAYSAMSRSNVRQAHNNLLHLINTIEDNEGLFLIYAATQDFFIDPKHGILVYGALARRIGQPERRPPRALDRVWNLDEVVPENEEYLDAACKIKEIFMIAHPETDDLDEAELRSYISELMENHPEFSTMSTWGVVIPATVARLDAQLDGDDPLSPLDMHDEIMQRVQV